MNANSRDYPNDCANLMLCSNGTVMPKFKSNASKTAPRLSDMSALEWWVIHTSILGPSQDLVEVVAD